MATQWMLRGVNYANCKGGAMILGGSILLVTWLR